jgi:DNA-binding response OmpR family regulator
MKRIMIVDDEPDTRFAVRTLLEKHGFEVIEASGGEEALKKLRENPVDLVVIDFLMPGMSGRVLAEEIRKDPKLKNLKLVFLTVATLGEVGKKELKKLKIDAYIPKPYENGEFVGRIREILRR